MDKKGHIYMARLVNEILEDNNFSLTKGQKIASSIGSILPDIKPSFINIRHNVEETFDIFTKKLKRTRNKTENNERLSLIKITEFLHYVCDYFIFPHNPNIWDGSLLSHIKYERTQHKEELKYIKDKEYKKDFKYFSFDKNLSTEDVFNEIMKKHKEYLLEERSFKTDCKYITCMFLAVFQWFIYKTFDFLIKI